MRELEYMPIGKLRMTREQYWIRKAQLMRTAAVLLMLLGLVSGILIGTLIGLCI